MSLMYKNWPKIFTRYIGMSSSSSESFMGLCGLFRGRGSLGPPVGRVQTCQSIILGNVGAAGVSATGVGPWPLGLHLW